MLKVLRALDRQELDDIIDAAEPAIESIVDGFFGVSEDFSSSDFDLAVPVDPGSAIDQPGDQPDVPELGWLDCYEFDVDEATECFQSYVATGEITDAEVPVVLRHPECGYADVGWGGALYGLSDEQFTARAEAARGCFLDLADAGLIDQWELPDEIVYFECFEGRNWYQVFDDPEYDLRFDACRNGAVGE
jgi:hypothetical protein